MKQSDLYLPNGYANMGRIMSQPYPFIFILGGRGTGKTYGALQYVFDEQLPFILMRRLQSQVDVISKDDFSPWKRLMVDRDDIRVLAKPMNKAPTAYFRYEMQDETPVLVGDPIGHVVALSTLSNMRGFDASDVQLLLFDEFIGEAHDRPIREEGKALLNCYETINRNRELQGEEPLKLVAIANSNDLACPLFRELGLIDVVDRMSRNHQSIRELPDRGVLIVMLEDSPISKAKRETALYKLASSGAYADMALSNSFSLNDYSYIKRQNVREYNPIAQINDCYIYQHKTEPRYYICRKRSGSPPAYGTGELERKRFNRDYGRLYVCLISGQVLFEDFYCKTVFGDFIGR